MVTNYEFKIFTNAAFSPYQLSKSNLVEAFASKDLKMLNSKEADTGEILFALKRAKSRKISRVYVLSEAFEVVGAINGVEDLSISALILNILSLSGTFENAHFDYIHRVLNDAAHRIAS